MFPQGASSRSEEGPWRAAGARAPQPAGIVYSAIDVISVVTVLYVLL